MLHIVVPWLVGVWYCGVIITSGWWFFDHISGTAPGSAQEYRQIAVAVLAGIVWPLFAERGLRRLARRRDWYPLD